MCETAATHLHTTLIQIAVQHITNYLHGLRKCTENLAKFGSGSLVMRKKITGFVTTQRPEAGLFLRDFSAAQLCFLRWIRARYNIRLQLRTFRYVSYNSGTFSLMFKNNCIYLVHGRYFISCFEGGQDFLYM